MSQENVEIVRTRLRPTATKRGRTVDERLFVRFPTLVPRLVSAAMHLPPHSRLRQAFFARFARRGWAASERGDLDLGLCGVDPAVEIRWPESGAGAMPDVRGVYRGHEGYREVWRAMHDPWDYEVRLEEIVDAVDRLVVSGEVTTRGRGSGIEMKDTISVLYVFRSGSVVREEHFNDRAEALEAAGLRE